MDLASRNAYNRDVRLKCEAMPLEDLRRAILQGQFGERKIGIAQACLAEKMEAAAADREIDRKIARGANRRSTLALLVAAGALAVAGYTAWQEHPIAVHGSVPGNAGRSR